MKISDRDKKIILIILIAVVIALPYLFVIKPYVQKQEDVQSEIDKLQVRYDELKALDDQREFYLSEIDRFTVSREEIIAKYAPGIRQENTIMFLRNLEFDVPVTMTSMSFTSDKVTPISEGVAQEDGTVVGSMNAIANSTSVSYECEYEDIKEFLKRILSNKERMVISNISIDYDSKTALVDGSFIIEQYAITGDDRILPPANIPAVPHGNESIFGTYISDEDLAAEREEAEGEGEESEDEEE